MAGSTSHGKDVQALCIYSIKQAVLSLYMESEMVCICFKVRPGVGKRGVINQTTLRRVQPRYVRCVYITVQIRAPSKLCHWVYEISRTLFKSFAFLKRERVTQQQISVLFSNVLARGTAFPQASLGNSVCVRGLQRRC